MKKLKLRKFLSSIKDKLTPKISSFLKEDVNSKNLRNLGKILLLVILLIPSLILLDVNKAISYRKYERVQFLSAGAILYANLYYLPKTFPFQEKRP